MKEYLIHLEGRLIGKTRLLEIADPSMGVVGGKIDFEPGWELSYSLLKAYCAARGIGIWEDEPEDAYITTSVIPTLVTLTPDGVAIESGGAFITGFDGEGYFIEMWYVPHPFYGIEFEHHVVRDREYWERRSQE
jgi:hypothetical protein